MALGLTQTHFTLTSCYKTLSANGVVLGGAGGYDFHV